MNQKLNIFSIHSFGREFICTFTKAPSSIQAKINVLFLLSCLVFIENCSLTDPSFEDHIIQIDVDTEVTEAWINLHIEGLMEDAQYIVSRNDSIIFKNKVNRSNFMIHDINLKPGYNYIFKAYAKLNNIMSDVEEITCTTMDSSIFSFNISTTLVPSAQFNHCWIWDADNYWIIGEYYPNDSLGSSMGLHTILSYENDKRNYIAVKYEAGWSSPLPITETSGFWAFNEKNVWFSMYDIQHWTGGTAQNIIGGGQKHFLFGFENNVLCVVGERGQIIKVIDDNILKSNLPEKYYISDIWGDSEYNLGLTVYDSEKRKPLLMFIKDDKYEKHEYNCPDNPNTMWFKNKNKIYLAGTNFYVFNRDASISELGFSVDTYVTKIRGTDINNIFAITWGGKIYHFNGVRWKLIYKINAKLNDIQVTDQFVLIAGNDSCNGYIIKITYN